MTGDWKSAGERPQIAVGTQLAVRMRGTLLGESGSDEMDGYYLNAFPLMFQDGCECFDEHENPEEQLRHDNHGCPCTGFYYVDPEGGDEAPYLPFCAVEWCKR